MQHIYLMKSLSLREEGCQCSGMTKLEGMGAEKEVLVEYGNLLFILREVTKEIRLFFKCHPIL